VPSVFHETGASCRYARCHVAMDGRVLTIA
jgi:hypothetical protein